MMTKKMRILVVLIACLIVGAGILAILLETAEEPRPQQTETDLFKHPVYSKYDFSPADGVVRIGIQPFWVFEANMAEAMRRDRLLRQDLARLGMRAEFFSFWKGVDVTFFMAKGMLDAGMSGFPPALMMTASHEIFIPALVDQSFDDLVALDCLTIHDLKGKSIGFPFGSDAHFMLAEALDAAGVKARLVPMDADEMIAGMKDGRISACAVWEPVTSTILSMNPDARVIHRSRWISFILFTNDFAKKHPEAVLCILAAQVRAIRWINADRENLVRSSQWAIEACKQLSPQAPALSIEDFAKQAGKVARLSMTPIISEEDLVDGGFLPRAFAFLKREGQIPADAKWEKTRQMFNTRLIGTVLKEPGKFHLNQFDYDTGENPS
ncbi:MAG: ABC transporter substrate-binding protein [Pseudomonadota bacterium]